MGSVGSSNPGPLDFSDINDKIRSLNAELDRVNKLKARDNPKGEFENLRPRLNTLNAMMEGTTADADEQKVLEKRLNNVVEKFETVRKKIYKIKSGKNSHEE